MNIDQFSLDEFSESALLTRFNEEVKRVWANYSDLNNSCKRTITIGLSLKAKLADNANLLSMDYQVKSSTPNAKGSTLIGVAFNNNVSDLEEIEQLEIIIPDRDIPDSLVNLSLDRINNGDLLRQCRWALHKTIENIHDPDYPLIKPRSITIVFTMVPNGQYPVLNYVVKTKFPDLTGRSVTLEVSTHSDRVIISEYGYKTESVDLVSDNLIQFKAS